MHEGVARAFSSLSTLLSSEEQRMVPMVPVTGRRYGAMHAFRFGRFVLSAAVCPPGCAPTTSNVAERCDPPSSFNR